MFRYSPITYRLFLTLLLLISSIFGAIYWLSVPLIKDNVFGIERNANRQVLNVVYDLASRVYVSTESFIEQALDAEEQKLKSVVDLTESYIRARLLQGRANGVEEQQVWQQIFSDLREFKFGNGNYVWVSDFESHLKSHPDDKFQNRDISMYSFEDGKSVLPGIISSAKEAGEGFYKYKWYRLNGTEVIDKYSYVRSFPQWKLVVGAGVYADDLSEEVAAYKRRLINELKEALKDVKIASNGYIYVFDSEGEMIYHPNSNINGTNFRTLLNPVTGKPIHSDLMAVSDTGEELYYKWDIPNDAGNYGYEKLSLVRHLSGLDWYIASSVYLDDLKSSSEQLSQRLMAMGFFALLATIVAAFLFAEWLTSPIKQLSNMAFKISRGNLQARTGFRRDDELGSLAGTFDYMADRLSENIDTLNTRVKERTRELAATETRQRLILDALPAQVAYVSRDRRFVFVNREYAQMFGCDKDTVVGQHLEDILPEQMFNDIQGYFNQALEGETVVYEYTAVIDGTEQITRRMLLPFNGEHDEVEGILNLSIDITAEKQSEKRLAEASKMKAVGQMSGGLAHDFNNLLTIILGNLLELQGNDELPEDLKRNLVPAIRATRRGADLTRRILAFSRRQPLSPQYIEARTLVDELVGLLTGPLPESIHISTRIDQDAPTVYLDPAQMEDALVNLALNAADEMDKGGDLSISVSAFTAPDGLVFDEAVREGDYLLIVVKDTGTGFSEQALEKAFEPFFTTKSTGAGSGLGLSMVYGFVKQSSGYIRLRNRHQEGAAVEILLPAVTRPDDIVEVDNQSRPVMDQSADSSSLVLLVEDNPDVRSVVRNQLVSIGFTVIEAESADEADHLLMNLNELAGVVSDIVMPGKLDGYDVARRVETLYPSAFIVLMTGYSETYAGQGEGFTLLQKPFDQATLMEGIFPEKVYEQ